MNGINIGVTEQLIIFGISCIIGVGLGVFYDLFRILRKAVAHNWLFIGLEDLIFFIGSTAYSFKFMISVLDGKVRFFIIIGELLGWVIYFFSLGVVIMKVSDKIIASVKALICIIMFPFIMVAKFLLKNLSVFTIISVKKFRKKTQHSNLHLKRRGILMYNFTKAHRRYIKNRRK